MTSIPIGSSIVSQAPTTKIPTRWGNMTKDQLNVATVCAVLTIFIVLLGSITIYYTRKRRGPVWGDEHMTINGVTEFEEEDEADTLGSMPTTASKDNEFDNWKIDKPRTTTHSKPTPTSDPGVKKDDVTPPAMKKKRSKTSQSEKSKHDSKVLPGKTSVVMKKSIGKSGKKMTTGTKTPSLTSLKGKLGAAKMKK